MNYNFLTLTVILLAAVILFILESYFPLHKRTQMQNIQNTFFNLCYGAFSIGITAVLLPSLNFESIGLSALKLYWAENIWLQLMACVFVFDFLAWLLHILNHRISLLWRLHAVHHSDLQLNTSSAIRFHVLEIFYTSVVHTILASFLGFSVEAVLLYRTLFTLSNLFQHSNFAMPYRFDQFFSYVFVTPRHHHIHHSVIREEQNTHFGSLFTFWDRLFFKNMKLAEQQVRYGITGEQAEVNQFKLLWMPFVKQTHYLNK